MELFFVDESGKISMEEPKITIKQIDISEYVPSNTFDSSFVFPSEGPRQEMIYLGPRMQKIKWYQFWRYHLIPEYNRQLVDSKQQFMNLYGLPTEKTL